MRYKSFTSRFLTAALFLLISGCSVLPINEEPVSFGDLPQFTETRLSREFRPLIDSYPDLSGHSLLLDSQESLSERLWLVGMAEKTLDVQYFLWSSDTSGYLFMQSLLAAAERGVKVRILIDGFSIADRHRQLAVLESVPNVDIRVYNPFIAKTGFGRVLNLIFNFDRLNQRMHNKSLIADHSVAIVGGRNIGDHYFGYADDMNFYDADITSVGPVVDDVSSSFNDYWNSPWAIPVPQFMPVQQSFNSETALDDFMSTDFGSSIEQTFNLTDSELTARLETLKKALIWAPTEFIADTPHGYISTNGDDQPKWVARTLSSLIESSEENITIESAYFVMDEPALEGLRRKVDSGVEVNVLTNSLASNNLIINHASYAMFRDQMLDIGLNLFELRPEINRCHDSRCENQEKYALHAKTAVFDYQTIYVGSMNFNLRSAYINTESGMIVHSPELALQLRQNIDRKMNLGHCWQVGKLDDDIFWVGSQNGQVHISREEPQSNWLQRFEVDLLTKLPGTAYY
jgi:putative cardiolipin synthase